jgi:Ca-activated chloride channel family protein
MKFQSLAALWLLAVLPCLVAGYVLLRRRRHNAMQYSSLALVRSALEAHHGLRSHLPAVFVLSALTICVLAVARPSAMIETPARERTIILAIDVSMSMGADDMQPSRLAAAQAAARSFILSQPEAVRIGILAFAGHALLVQPPTVDRPQVLDAVRHLKLQHATAVGSGIVGALMTIFPDDRFAEAFDIFGMSSPPVLDDRIRVERDRNQGGAAEGPEPHPSSAIVVLTDGADTGGVPPDLAARFAAERGVRVYTVGFGVPATAGSNQDPAAGPAGFDEAALKRIAKVTGGEYFPARSAQQLETVYRTLPGRIVMQSVGTEFAPVLAGIAFLLSVLACGLSLVWARPLPA